MWNRKGRRDEANYLENGYDGEFCVVAVEYEF